jgi:hypothetical protein
VIRKKVILPIIIFWDAEIVCDCLSGKIKATRDAEDHFSLPEFLDNYLFVHIGQVSILQNSLRPKTFGINFHPRILDTFLPKNCIN